MVIENFHPGDDGNVVLRSFFSESFFVRNVHVAPMSCSQRVNAVAEGFPQKLERALTDPKREQTFLMFENFRPGNR